MKRRNIFVLSLTVILLGITVGLLRYEPQIRGKLERPNFARYRFQQLPLPDAQPQINFLEKRISKGQGGALDQAGLAGMYLAQAKFTGNPFWFDKATDMAKASLKSLPVSNPAALLVLAKVAEAKHQFGEALSITQRVLKEHPDNREATTVAITSNLAVGNLDEAARAADSMAQERPGLTSYSLWALTLSAQGRDEEAVFAFRKALSVEDIGELSQSAWVRTVFARFYVRRGQFVEADDLIQEALRLVPWNHLALSVRGDADLLRGNFKKAADDYWNAFSSSRQLPYLRKYALAQKLNKDDRAANEALLEAEKLARKELQEGAYGHRLELARVLLDKGKPEGFKEAIGLAKEELKTRRNADTLCVLARANAKSKNWAPAQIAISALLRTGVRDAEYYYLAGEIAKGSGNAEKSELYFTLATELFPRYGEAEQVRR